MKIIVAVFLALLLAGCAAQAGTDDSRFQTGKTTMQEVEHALGRANTNTQDGARKTACYRYAGLPTVPERFIRIIGSWSQEADLTCCFSFTGDGVLAGTASKMAQVNTALMAAAKTDAQAGRTARCPPLMHQPGAVMRLPFAGGH